MANCPECDTLITTDDDVEEGETLDCPECGLDLEVVSTHPLELDVVVGDEEEKELY